MVNEQINKPSEDNNGMVTIDDQSSTQLATRDRPSGQLTTRDLITIGVYTVVYIVVMFIAGIPFGFSPVLTYALPISVAFFCAPVYFLLLAKVPKRGTIAILGTVMGLVLFVTGMFWLWAVTCAILGVIAGEIAGAKQYRSAKLNMLSYIVFALAPLSSYAMMWINQSAYLDYLVSKGTDPAYMEKMVTTATPWLLPTLIGLIIVAAWLGALYSRRLLARHFVRAGIVA